MNAEGHAIERSILGERAEGAGHPVILGLFIMAAHPDLDDALTRTPNGWPQAMGKGCIPGGSLQIYDALAMLRTIRDGVRTAPDAIEDARVRWAAKSETPDTTAAQEQADRFADDYMARAGEWLALTPIPSP